MIDALRQYGAAPQEGMEALWRRMGLQYPDPIRLTICAIMDFYITGTTAGAYRPPMICGDGATRLNLVSHSCTMIINSIMDQLQTGDQVIRFDAELTRQAYASLKDGDAERCGCVYCRNFVAQRRTLYPEVFRRLLDRIGIDFEKEGEVYECGADVSLRIYGGWFYFAGKLVEHGERLTDGGSGFQYHFVDAKHLPKAPADFGDNLAAVEFYTKAPWVLPEQPS